MKILQINVTVNSGSTGRIAEQIGALAIEKGFTSFVAYSRKTTGSISKEVKIGNQLDTYWHVLNTRLFDTHGFSSKKVTGKFVKKVNEIDPDVIHIHNLHGYYLHVGELFVFLKDFDKPVIWTFHDCWPFTGHCAYFDRVNCEKWKTQCHSCPLTKYYPTSWGFDNSKCNFKKKKYHFTGLNNCTIVTPSKWMHDLVKQSFLKDYPVKVIHNGVDIEIFKPSQLDIRKKYHIDQPKMILGVANIWDRRKGLDDFIQLTRNLRSDIKIVLVGLSKTQLNELPLDIIGIERTENVDELVALYSAADIYVNPTYSDNFPTTNIEALACGTPVITYETGGSLEAIDNATGLRVAKGDIDGLEHAIYKIIDDRLNFNSENCRKRAKSFFNKRDRYEDYLNLYKRVIL